jgi:hypothetical protein
MRRSSDSSGLKGVSLVRGGQTYAVNLPKFSPPPNANSININRDDVHEHFRRLSPKQRIAVLTISDQNIAGRLYSYSNKLWCQEIHVMRKSVGPRDDDDIVSRTFYNSFEYLFGESDDLNDSDHEDTHPLLGKKTVQSSLVTATNRPFNSTFSYSSSNPTVFKPKLNFISTKDVLKVMIDGSKDFCSSKARARSRILQRPEMWDRIVDSKEDSASGPEYESFIYQLMEFRVLYEYLNGGAGGEPFSNIKAQNPTDAEKWAQKEKSLVEMEEGSTTSTAPTTPAVSVESSKNQNNPGPKKTRKKRLMEKIAAAQQGTESTVPVPEQSDSKPADNTSSESSDDEPQPVVEEKASIPEPTFPYIIETESEENDDWIEVGVGSKLVKKKPTNNSENLQQSRYKLSEENMSYKFKSWTWSDTQLSYVSNSLKATTCRTFLEVVHIQKQNNLVRECPF